MTAVYTTLTIIGAASLVGFVYSVHWTAEHVRHDVLVALRGRR